MKGLLRVPRPLGPRPAPDPEFDQEYRDTVEVCRFQMQQFDSSAPVWRSLWRDYGVDTVEETIASLGGMTTAAKVREVLERRLGKPI